MKIHKMTMVGVGAVGVCALVGCAEQQPVEAPRGLKLAVAPLSLEGIDFACYDILVANATGPVVVLGDPAVAFPDDTATICSNQYGNGVGGDITYIAPCDASTSGDVDLDVDGTQNTVTLWIDGLYRGGVDISAGGVEGWENPCGTAGCSLDFLCEENADTLVEFNFTIMRNAQQGFFDIAVNFDDIFCSAKVDCMYADNSYIRLVHGSTGRTASAVTAIACTDGDATADTTLYASDLVIDCDGEDHDYALPLDEAGNLYGRDTNGDLLNPDGFLAQATVFMGKQSITNSSTGANADSLYWNIAVGFDEVGQANPPELAGSPTNCTLSLRATAFKGSLAATMATATTYPYIQATVELTDENGAFTCGAHPLNGADGAVATGYTAPGAGFGTSLNWFMAQSGDDVTVSPYSP